MTTHRSLDELAALVREPCPSGKNPYFNRDDAWREARRIERTGRLPEGAVISAYPCRACGLYHVGKATP